MTKFSFAAHVLKRGLAMARLIKPSSGDFAVRFSPGGALFFSADKRRMAFVNVPASDRPDVDDGWQSEEYFIPISKAVLFDADLDSVSFTLTDTALAVHAHEGSQTKKATVKRRIESTRRSLIPAVRWGDPTFVNADKFSRLLRMVGCSALVKETKTEEEMRVNQVHFHSSLSCASANARYYASAASLDGMDLDVSIIGSDIPLIRSFCSKLDGTVGLYHDKHRLYVVDPGTNSAIVMGKVASASVEFSVPTEEFSTEVVLSRDRLRSGLEWAMAALDGTQRLTCEVGEDGMKMSNNGEIFSMPASMKLGSSFTADLPAKFLRTAADHLDSDEILMKFGHPKHPTLVEVTSAGDSDICIRHYLNTMRGR